MTHCFPPLSALVRPDHHRGHPMTAETDTNARARAERLLVQAAATLAALDSADPSPDLLIDNNGEVWLRRRPGVDFHCVTSNLDDRTEAEVADSFGPVREYGLRPARPGG